MKHYSIRQQVAGLTFIPLLIMAIGMEFFFLHDRFADMDSDLLNKGELIVHQLSASSEYGVFSNNQGFLQNIASGALQQQDVRGVAVLNAAFGILASAGEFSVPLQSEIFAKTLTTNNLIKKQLSVLNNEKLNRAIVLQPSITGEGHSLWLYHAIIPAQIALEEDGATTIAKPVGAVIIEISKRRYEENKKQMLWTTLAATSLFLAFVSYLIYLASRSIIDPIRSLSDAVQEIGQGKLDTRVSLTTRVSELSTLAQGLNETTAHLQQERESLQHRINEATQALREKKEEAELASQGKSHFLAVASHDLRQPLHAMGLYVAELQRRISGADQLYLVQQVGHSIEALSTLLNALLDISKLDAGVIVPQMQPCNVATLLERIATDFQMLADQKNIRLIVRPYHGFVGSDPQLLERILMNLISNAIRYTPLNGCILVACRKRGASLRIEVRDNGIGISAADQKNIFQEFFQIAQPELNANKGLGLGLSIVDRLVKLLGHRIELRSRPGAGTTFAVEALLADSAVKHPSATQTLFDYRQDNDALSSLGKKILVIDDDMAVLSSTSSLMRSWDCIVNPAASFAQVEQLLREGQTWDLIVSDYQLGEGKNGIDVVTLVRQHHNKMIPCVFISGDTSPSVLKLMSVNGGHFLQKPVKPGKLRSLIVHLLSSSSES